MHINLNLLLSKQNKFYTFIHIYMYDIFLRQCACLFSFVKLFWDSKKDTCLVLVDCRV